MILRVAVLSKSLEFTRIARGTPDIVIGVDRAENFSRDLAYYCQY